jgi:hypothetical protein
LGVINQLNGNESNIFMENEFKYQAYLSKYRNCPEPDCRVFIQSAYRWLHKGLHEDNFRPVSLINPNRAFGTDRLNCISYALSMFDTENGAYDRYKQVVERKMNLKDKLGTLIGEISLEEKDGVGTEPEVNNFGHFSFFERKDIDLSDKIIRFVEIFNENGRFTR